MGSADTTMADLPAATSPSVVLAHPTDDEKRQTWTMNANEWAGALTPEEYLERELYLVTIPINRNGGITHWILTTSGNDIAEAGSSSGSERLLLSSCESIMKKVLVASPTGDGAITEEIGHGIGSVYTSPEFRGRSYASRMLAEVGVQLENWDLAPQGADISSSKNKKKAICSTLWSDIGKKFYAKKGWVPFASQHVEFLAGDFHREISAAKAKLPSTPITYGNVADFCALDEAALREKLAKTARETGKTAMAFSPSHDQMLWHLYRDSYIASLVFPDRDPNLANVEDGKNNTTTNDRGNSPSPSSSSSASPPRQPRSAAALRRHPGKLEANEVKGIAVGPVGRRVWAIWMRNYSKGPLSPKDNTLYILRLVVENEDQQHDNAQLVESFTAVIRAAQTTAQQWSCGRVDLWNPEGVVARLLRDSELEHEVIEREEASIPSLMWYGEGTKSEDVVWVNNEKYCWC
ncbi:acetyl-CoA:lysine N6-acetyltransferase [Microdochium nivale]|nr:acetyl-CoA:lysine N6-acetyltransferase [Microdochium nivale]